MIAYQSNDLQQIFVQEQAALALEHDCLQQSEYHHILKAYPAGFYSPNLFIRIGLFMLTLVIALFSFGLLLLLFLNSVERLFGGLALFFGLLLYAALEYMVQIKKHFQSGVDDALLWASGGFLCGGMGDITNAGNIGNCILLFIIALYYSLRFADRLMSVVTFIALLGIFFFTAIKMGPGVKAFLPFIIMVVSALAYWLAKRLKVSKINQLYQHCLQFVSIAALFCFYAGGNYFVVRELNNELFNLHLPANEGIPFGWLFWCFTFMIPLAYFIGGILKKDIVLIRVALLLFVAIVFTVRHYYQLLPVEIWMIVGGTGLSLVTYGLSRYLQTPKYGFTNISSTGEAENERLKIESLLLAETFSNSNPATVEGTKFGGGDFGGGGATGDY
jgi:hypothetical protein